jgi:hypothetical protein
VNNLPILRLFPAIAALLLFVPGIRQAHAEPTGCDLLADMAIVARALAQEGVPQEQSTRIMARIYTAPPSLINNMAAGAAQDTRTPTEVAQAVLQACHRKQGPRESSAPRKTL